MHAKISYKNFSVLIINNANFFTKVCKFVLFLNLIKVKDLIVFNLFPYCITGKQKSFGPHKSLATN